MSPWLILWPLACLVGGGVALFLSVTSTDSAERWAYLWAACWALDAMYASARLRLAEIDLMEARRLAASRWRP